MTLAQNTDFIFLDEPLNNLDLHHAVEIMTILRNLADDEGKGIVLVMHDINLASIFADRLVVLKEGRLESVGSADEIMDSGLLSRVYSMPLAVRQWQGHKICLVDLPSAGASGESRSRQVEPVGRI